MYRIAIVIMLAALLTVSCTGQKKDTGGRLEVEFWHALGGPLGDALTELIAQFNRENPDIFIKAISMGNYTALSQKIMASIQAGTQPDIAQVYESWTSGLVAGGVLLSLDELIENDESFTEADFEDIYPVFLQSNYIDGKLWSFPFNKSVRVLYYNKDILFQAGLDPNRPPTNWQEFREISRIVNEKLGVMGTTFGTSVWQFQNLLLQAGGEMMTPDYKKPLFNSKEGVRALNHLTAMLIDDKTAYLSSGFEGQNDFLAGKVAMMEGSSVSTIFMKNSGIEFFLGITALPGDVTDRSVVSGTNICLFDSKNPAKHEAAWRFIKWFTDTEQTAKWSEKTYYMPVRRSAFKEENLVRRLNANPEMASVYHQLESATFEPPISEWFEVRKYMEEHVLEKVMRRRVTAKEALDDAAKKLSDMLK